MNRRLPALTLKKLIKAPEGASYVTCRTKGSHMHIAHPERPGVTFPIPLHNKDLKRGALADMIKQAGLSQEEFLDLL